MLAHVGVRVSHGSHVSSEHLLSKHAPCSWQFLAIRSLIRFLCCLLTHDIVRLWRWMNNLELNRLLNIWQEMLICVCLDVRRIFDKYMFLGGCSKEIVRFKSMFVKDIQFLVTIASTGHSVSCVTLLIILLFIIVINQRHLNIILRIWKQVLSVWKNCFIDEALELKKIMTPILMIKIILLWVPVAWLRRIAHTENDSELSKDKILFFIF